MLTGILALAMALFSCASVFSGCSKRGDSISDAVRQGMADRTENAQYMPEPQTVYGQEESKESAEPMRASVLAEEPQSEENAFSIFAFEDLVNSLAVLEGVASGKYLGYDVFEVKTEMYNMVSRAPWLNEWFRVPRPENGVDYFSDWAYLIENDLENNFLSVTRICWKTRASYYDPETGREVEDYEGGSAIQYNVMRTEYYFEGTSEVVEVSMFDVMLAHGNTYPLAYQYLKNVKDSYFVKYYIEAMPRTYLGYAIDTQTPYGADRTFDYMTYDRRANFDYLHVSQRYPNAYRNSGFGLEDAGASFGYVQQKNGAERRYDYAYDYPESGEPQADIASSNTAGYGELKQMIADMAVSLGCAAADAGRFVSQTEESDAQALDDFMTDLSREEIEQSDLKNHWQEIYDNSSDAEESILPEVSLPLKVKYSYVSAKASGDGSVFVDAEAYLTPNPSLRNITECDYMIAPAWIDENANLTPIGEPSKSTGNDYEDDMDIMWHGAWLKCRRNIPAEELFSGLESGKYALAFALWKEDTETDFGNRFMARCDHAISVQFQWEDKLYELYTEHNILMLNVSDV